MNRKFLKRLSLVLSESWSTTANRGLWRRMCEKFSALVT